YKKIGASSEYRLLLRKVGLETVNLYSAFLGLAVGLTKPGGEIVAIVPRSFCNGLYFKPFRRWLLERAAIRHIHVFESRKKAFSDDGVLQENVIIKLERLGKTGPITISTSADATFADFEQHELEASDVVKPDDQECFFRLPIGTQKSDNKLFTHSLK